MKLSTIPNVYRNVNRAREIVSVLSKYGLADWISRFNLDFAKNIFKDPAGKRWPGIRARPAFAWP